MGWGHAHTVEIYGHSTSQQRTLWKKTIFNIAENSDLQHHGIHYSRIKAVLNSVRETHGIILYNGSV